MVAAQPLINPELAVRQHNRRDDVTVRNDFVGGGSLIERIRPADKRLQVDLPRPRQLEEVDVARAAREILDPLREEINKSLEVEYGVRS